MKAKTVVLVHGAFADGSSWRKVIPPLEKAGLKVIAVQNPLDSLENDVAATKRAIRNCGRSRRLSRPFMGWRRHHGSGERPKGEITCICRRLCFGSQEAMTQFMQNPKDNLAKAQTYYSSKHPG